MSKPSKANRYLVSTYRLTIHGRIQGVGFRPMAYRIAKKLSLNGTISNSPHGAVIEINTPKYPAQQSAGRDEGLQKQHGTHPHRAFPGGRERAILKAFVAALKKNLPPNSKIDSINIAKIPYKHFPGFSISKTIEGNIITAEAPADTCVCEDCLKEMFDRNNRRYLYPFINCTNCGPRFSIIRSLPYDRPKTTMAEFDMCPECLKEYNDPADRRFHAQPNACPVCGPKVTLLNRSFKQLSDRGAAIFETCRLIKKGYIIAIKGIGGYHLACDAGNLKAIEALRKRKNRPHKPLALMVKDIKTARSICHVSKYEEKLLLSPQRPIVLLKKKQPESVLAPGNAYLGLMLPYAPLHFLLFANSVGMLVMTSGNKKDEPISITEEQARLNLSVLADFFLIHDRPIHNRCDDSIMFVLPDNSGKALFVRRSRGFVPFSFELEKIGGSKKSVLGTGAELKNTFCLSRENKAFVSQYIGDLDEQEALSFYNEAFERVSKFLKVRPSVVVSDLHPDYLTTIFARKYCKRKKARYLQLQHHFAHIASVIVEHRLKTPILGFAFDGLGLGEDGNIWGGEIVHCKGRKFNRLAHLKYFALPGGDTAAKEIWRIGLSLLRASGITGIPEHFKKIKNIGLVNQMLDRNINSPLCSSMGRLFDGVAALAGIRNEVTFEAQAALELESIGMDFSVQKVYNFSIEDRGKFEPSVVSFSGIINGIWKDLQNKIPPGIISAKFHKTIAVIMLALAEKYSKEHKTKRIVLSGGVFQNRLLLTMSKNLLANKGFKIYFNTAVPPNDGGISLGQVWHGYNYNRS